MAMTAHIRATAPKNAAELWQAIVTWLTKNGPQAIRSALIGGAFGYGVNVFLMLFVFDGYVKFDGSGSLLGSVLRSTAFFSIGSAILFGLISYRHAVGKERFWKEIQNFPATIGTLFRHDGQSARAHLLWGAGLSLLAAQVISPWLGAIIALGLFSTISSPIGNIISGLLLRAWSSLAIQFASTQSRPVTGPLSITIGILGASAALALGFFVTGSSAKLVLALTCIAAAVVLGKQQNSSSNLRLFLFLSGMTAVLHEVLYPLIALAHDGGYRENGGDLGQLFASGGGKTLLTSATVGGAAAAIGAPIGSAIGNILGGSDSSDEPPSVETTTESALSSGGDPAEGDDDGDEANAWQGDGEKGDVGQPDDLPDPGQSFGGPGEMPDSDEPGDFPSGEEDPESSSTGELPDPSELEASDDGESESGDGDGDSGESGEESPSEDKPDQGAKDDEDEKMRLETERERLRQNMLSLGQELVSGVDDPERRQFYEGFLNRNSEDPEKLRRAIDAIRTQIIGKGELAAATSDAEWWGRLEKGAEEIRDWTMRANRALSWFVPGGDRVVAAQAAAYAVVEGYQEGGARGALGRGTASVIDNMTWGMATPIYNNYEPPHSGEDVKRMLLGAASDRLKPFDPEEYGKVIQGASDEWKKGNVLGALGQAVDAVENAVDAGREVHGHVGSRRTHTDGEPEPQAPKPAQGAEEATPHRPQDDVDARQKTEEAEAATKRRADEEAEAKRRAEEEAEVRRKAEEEAAARLKAEEEAAAKRKAEEAEAEARRIAEQEAEEAAARLKADEEVEAKRKADEAEADARRKADEEAEAKRKAEEEAARRQEEDLRRKQEEQQRQLEEHRRSQEEQAARQQYEQQQQQQQAKQLDEAAAQRLADIENERESLKQEAAQARARGDTAEEARIQERRRELTDETKRLLTGQPAEQMDLRNPAAAVPAADGTIPGYTAQQHEEIRRVLQESFPDLEGGYVFGSTARGAIGRDLDLAVVINRRVTPNDYIAAEQVAKRLERLLNTKVDIKPLSPADYLRDHKANIGRDLQPNPKIDLF